MNMGAKGAKGAPGAALGSIATVLLALAIAGADAAAEQQAAGDGSTRSGFDQPLVDAAPVRCWWRTSAGAVRLGEPFDVRLTCAALETDAFHVVLDESRLTVAGVALKPFEVLDGSHPSDTRAGRRRFFQYRYTLRLLDPETLGKDVSLPRLPITYRINSRVAEDATLTGRDFTYLMPELTVRVLSQLPASAGDIRDSADLGLERVDALQFRARLFDIGAVALLAGAALMGALAVSAIVAGTRPAAARQRSGLSSRRVLSTAAAELTRVARDAESGWTPELVSAGHAALRLVAALALGRPLSEQPLAAGAAPADGRIAVRALIPTRPGAAVTSVTTPADLATAIGTPASETSSRELEGLGTLRDALATFTAAQFAAGGSPRDAAALSAALEAGRAEALRIARARRWWPRKPMVATQTSVTHGNSEGPRGHTR
jgi:hypothetical protein